VLVQVFNFAQIISPAGSKQFGHGPKNTSGNLVMMRRISLCSLLLIVVLAIAGETGTSKAYAGTSFDGGWTVVISTDSGTCDSTNRLGIDIREGALQYSGDFSVLVRGRVATNGLVHVRISSGNQTATGSGRLSANSGTGTWRGSSSAISCAGRWSAERR